MSLQAAVVCYLAGHEVCDVWMRAHLLARRLVDVYLLYGLAVYVYGQIVEG